MNQFSAAKDFAQSPPYPCPACGSCAGTKFNPVMWQALGEEWGLSEEEYVYIDRQQGEACIHCGSSLRSQALALAITRTLGYRGSLAGFTRSLRGRLTPILEINGAGHLTQFFPRRSRHVLRSFPDLDMMRMSDIPTGQYSLVVHSDTLEHIPDPIKALSECCRVLRPRGACCFTIPIIVGRLTRTRKGLPPSYHGIPQDRREDHLVQTEYGADAWRQLLAAGFAEVRIVAVQPPAAHALVGIKE
jgi:SAM-dependent methyltransferase